LIVDHLYAIVFTPLGVTALSIAEQSFTRWAYALIAMIVLVLAPRTEVHPILIRIGGVALGWVIGALTAPAAP
jgi:hypothetical protein